MLSKSSAPRVFLGVSNSISIVEVDIAINIGSMGPEVRISGLILRSLFISFRFLNVIWAESRSHRDTQNALMCSGLPRAIFNKNCIPTFKGEFVASNSRLSFFRMQVLTFISTRAVTFRIVSAFARMPEFAVEILAISFQISHANWFVRFS